MVVGTPPVPVHGPLGTGPYSRRRAASDWAKLHLYLRPLPIACITAWAPPPARSAAALDARRSVNPTANPACEGSRLRAPYENLMPDDLRWSWGGDASAGEKLQIQIIIRREVWRHKDHNKSIACRLISKPYQWASLVAQWLRICLPMQETRVRALVMGIPHMPRSNWAREPQLLSLRVWSLCSTREAVTVRGPRTVIKSGPRLPQLEKALAQKRRPNTAKNK